MIQPVACDGSDEAARECCACDRGCGPFPRSLGRLEEIMPQTSVFAEPRINVKLEECLFYHVMDLPGLGRVGGQWDLRERVDSYLGNVDFTGKRVLEIGPASGFLTFAMEQRGASVVCVELTTEKAWDFVPYPEAYLAPIREQRRTVIAQLTNSFWLAHGLHGSSAKVHYGNIYSLPEELGSFDICVLSAVLLHCQNPTLVLEQCARRATTIIIVELLHTRLEGTPVCELAPTPDNKRWDTWWSFSSDFFVQYLRVLDFNNIARTEHTQLHKDRFEMPMFTIVAARSQ
jgi:O-methyltransferase